MPSKGLLVDPSDPSDVERIATKYKRKGFGIFDRNYKILDPKTCYKMVILDRTYTIYLLARWEIEKIHEIEGEEIVKLDPDLAIWGHHRRKAVPYSVKPKQPAATLPPDTREASERDQNQKRVKGSE